MGDSVDGVTLSLDPDNLSVGGEIIRNIVFWGLWIALFSFEGRGLIVS